MGTDERITRRYLIVDDSEVFLSAARALLEREGAVVVGAATTSAEAIRLATKLRPDVILVDIELGDESGFDLARRLAAERSTRVVLISADPEKKFARLVATSPAAGFLWKSELSTRAVDALLGTDGQGASQ